MEHDRHILNSNNIKRTSWKLINKELGEVYKNYGIKSININGTSNSNLQIIADAFNKHFTAVPDMIILNNNAHYCLTKTSVNNHNKLSYSLTVPIYIGWTAVYGFWNTINK